MRPTDYFCQTVPESGRLLEELGDLLQLRDGLLGVAAVLTDKSSEIKSCNKGIIIEKNLFEEREDVVELGAGVGLEERLEAGVHLRPGRSLLRRVIHVGNRLATKKSQVTIT